MKGGIVAIASRAAPAVTRLSASEPKMEVHG
jgi:hypothetical protein